MRFSWVGGSFRRAVYRRRGNRAYWIERLSTRSSPEVKTLASYWQSPISALSSKSRGSSRGRSSLDLDDLVQEGIVGLLKAIDRYDPSRGFKLITYAVWWIRQALMQATNDVGHLIRLPLNVKTDVARLRKVRRRLTRLRSGTPPDIEELATTLDWETSRVQFLLEVADYRAESLEQPLSEDSSVERKDVLPTREPSPEALLMSRERTSTIQAILESLEYRDREIMIRYFGLNGERFP